MQSIFYANILRTPGELFLREKPNLQQKLLFGHFHLKYFISNENKKVRLPACLDYF